MRKVASVLLVVVVLVSSGCAYRYSFVTGQPASGEKIKMWQHISSWGWNDPQPIDLDEVSPGGVAEFGSYISFTNWLCTFFTLGFYSPQTAYVIPAESSALRTGGRR